MSAITVWRCDVCGTERQREPQFIYQSTPGHFQAFKFDARSNLKHACDDLCIMAACHAWKEGNAEPRPAGRVKEQYEDHISDGLQLLHDYAEAKGRL